MTWQGCIEQGDAAHRRLYEALLRRDPGFDGRFFVGVRTTGVYCRSICPAPKPKRRNCVFYRTAAEAERQAETLLSTEDEAVDFTPQLMAMSLLRGLNEIRIPLQESVDEIEPPDQIADLHHRMWDWHKSFIAVETACSRPPKMALRSASNRSINCRSGNRC